jgi:hypothetical protein
MIVFPVSTDPDPHPAAEFVDRYIMKCNDRVRVQFLIPHLGTDLLIIITK